ADIVHNASEDEEEGAVEDGTEPPPVIQPLQKGTSNGGTK
ncbi:hypothetical protein AVEN_130458-1, partial [Araneus ventricosus]